MLILDCITDPVEITITIKIVLTVVLALAELSLVAWLGMAHFYVER